MLITDEEPRAVLGPCRLGNEEVVELARSALREPTARIGRWWVEPVDYAFGSPTTGGLFRVRGVTAGVGAPRPWSVFVKLVQSYRHWPLLQILPPQQREEALNSVLWRYEADVYAAGLGGALPAGLRLPRVHRMQDLGEDRLALFLEDVRTSTTQWGPGHFSRAADLLGRLSARLTRLDALPASACRIPGEITRLHYTSRLLVAALPALYDDATWAHPALLAADRELRSDLGELARRIPRILDTLARLPQLLIHGDASPQNLLVCADEPTMLVALDWTLGGLAAAGDDLGQLLVGLAHAGQRRTAELPELRELIARAYTAGLAEEGVHVDEATVRYGMDGGLVVRSAFTALPLERLHEPLTHELIDVIEARLGLTRYLVDLGLALPR